MFITIINDLYIIIINYFLIVYLVEIYFYLRFHLFFVLPLIIF